MHQSLRKCVAVLSMATLGLSAVAQAATPAEKIAITITRTAASGIQSTDSLAKNVFRQESVQVPYTVQEPYTDTETYYEQVPYQDTETYYEDVPYYEQEAYTDYEDYTDYEYRCEERSREDRKSVV